MYSAGQMVMEITTLGHVVEKLVQLGIGCVVFEGFKPVITSDRVCLHVNHAE